MTSNSGISVITDSNQNVSSHKVSKVLGWLKGVDRRAQRTRREREDLSIREIARALGRENWKVQVEIPGYESPRVAGLRVKPDLVATLGDRTVIVEVKTGKSTKERNRVMQLRNFAKATPGISLHVVDASQPFGAIGRKQ